MRSSCVVHRELATGLEVGSKGGYGPLLGAGTSFWVYFWSGAETPQWEIFFSVFMLGRRPAGSLGYTYLGKNAKFRAIFFPCSFLLRKEL